MRNEMNFVGTDVSDADRALFLGPFDENDGPFLDLPAEWSMAHVMHAAGVFTSVGQARRNGWDRPVPRGFDKFTVGKRRLAVYTLTRFD